MIALKTGSQVDFGAREPEGDVAVSIFMSHGLPGIEFCNDHVEAARGILGLCAGLPIALAVTGDAVSFRVHVGLRFQTACEKYLELLSESVVSGLHVLDAAISLSLDSLQDCFNEDGDPKTPYTLQEMYCSLCVFENKHQALVFVLCRMWNTEESTALGICVRFSSMSLCNLATSSDDDGKEELRVNIHDLLLELVRRMAWNSSIKWHRRLDNALSGAGASSKSVDGGGTTSSWVSALTAATQPICLSPYFLNFVRQLEDSVAFQSPECLRDHEILSSAEDSAPRRFLKCLAELHSNSVGSESLNDTCSEMRLRHSKECLSWINVFA